MKRPLFALLGLAAVAASPLQAVKIANPASDQLMKLTDLQRRGALRGALLDSGYSCPRVERAAMQGPWKNMIMWRAQCSITDARFDYGIFVGPDASIQARPCGEMAELKLPACRPFSAKTPSR
jgi:hypothetical protein